MDRFPPLDSLSGFSGARNGVFSPDVCSLVIGGGGGVVWGRGHRNRLVPGVEEAERRCFEQCGRDGEGSGGKQFYLWDSDC